VFGKFNSSFFGDANKMNQGVTQITSLPIEDIPPEALEAFKDTQFHLGKFQNKLLLHLTVNKELCLKNVRR
jgi:hypothetical protein